MSSYLTHPPNELYAGRNFFKVQGSRVGLNAGGLVYFRLQGFDLKRQVLIFHHFAFQKARSDGTFSAMPLGVSR